MKSKIHEYKKNNLKMMSNKIFVSLFFFLIICSFTEAQSQSSISSKIMDAYLSTTSGELSVFLTDTLGISSVELSVGTVPDTFSVYSEQFIVTGNSFGAGTISNNTLHTTIAGLNSNTTYYTRIRIFLDNSQYNEIEIKTN